MHWQIKFAALVSRRCQILQKVRQRFLHTARGTSAEVDTQVVPAQEFGYLAREDIGEMDEQIQGL